MPKTESEGNLIVDRSFAFAVRIVKLSLFLNKEKREHVLSKQLLRAGTSIGANIAEAQESFSERDFAAKLSIARKEAGESIYWLKLLFETEFLSEPQFNSLYRDVLEIKKILSSIILTIEQKSKKTQES